MTRLALLALLALALSGCHLHVHLGGQYNYDKADDKRPPFELVFPERENDDAEKNRRDQN